MLMQELKPRPFPAQKPLLQLHNSISLRLAPLLRVPKCGVPEVPPGLTVVNTALRCHYFLCTLTYLGANPIYMLHSAHNP